MAVGVGGSEDGDGPGPRRGRHAQDADGIDPGSAGLDDDTDG